MATINILKTAREIVAANKANEKLMAKKEEEKRKVRAREDRRRARLLWQIAKTLDGQSGFKVTKPTPQLTTWNVAAVLHRNNEIVGYFRNYVETGERRYADDDPLQPFRDHYLVFAENWSSLGGQVMIELNPSDEKKSQDDFATALAGYFVKKGWV